MDENKDNNVATKNDHSGLITFLVLIIFGIVIWNGMGKLFYTDDTGEEIGNLKPTNIEVMSYAQTVLENELSNPNYSRRESDYTIVGNDLRYKIEGKVNNEKFYMIIEFVDNTYKEYDLLSLQIGNKKY